VFALGAGFAACSSSSSPPTTPASTTGSDAGGGSEASSSAAPDSGGGSGDDGGSGDGGITNVDGNTVGDAGSCPNPTVGIVFSPMYSAFIPADNVQQFLIPAITDDGNTATWSVSDPTQAQLLPEAFNGNPGVMITVTGPGTGSTGDAGSIGQLTVIATESDGTCGSATLNITSATSNDWTIGETRYNNNVVLTLAPPDGGGFGGFGGPPPDGGFPDGAFPEGGPMGGMGGGPGRLMRAGDAGSYYELDGGTACTSCHGVTATTGPYRDVSHTPEQTGGFSDTDLIGIITQGIIPDGGYFDPSVIIATCDAGGPTAACYATAYDRWHSFHQWSDITPDQYAGIVVYLRSLEPMAQNGSPANFGGGGGRGRRDGGMRPPGAEAGPGPGPADAASE
jgi:hypothetical protein